LSAAWLVEWLVGDTAWSREVLDFRGPLELIRYDPNDPLAIHLPDEDIIAEPCRIVWMALDKNNTTRARAITYSTDLVHWWVDPLDSTTYIDIFPKSRTMEWIVNGVLVARVVGREWQITGDLWTGIDYSASPTQPTMVARTGQSITFAVRKAPAGNRYVNLEMTEEGDLRVGEFWEKPDVYVYDLVSPLGDYVDETSPSDANLLFTFDLVAVHAMLGWDTGVAQLEVGEIRTRMVL
jgi:hypothetical protein